MIYRNSNRQALVAHINTLPGNYKIYECQQSSTYYMAVEETLEEIDEPA